MKLLHRFDSRPNSDARFREEYRAVFDPGEPVAYCLCQKVVCDCAKLILDAEVPRQTEIEFLRQGNRALFAHNSTEC